MKSRPRRRYYSGRRSVACKLGDELAASMAPSCRLSLSGRVPVLDGMEVAGHQHPDGTLALSVEEDVGRRTCIRDMY
jgi:hypothetical protein